MAKNISFSTGEKEYIINGDESKVIRVNVADVNMITRYEAAAKELEEYQNTLPDEPSPSQFAEIDSKIRELIDEVFGADVCSVAFGKTNALTPVGGGKPLYQAFLEAFLPEIEKDIKSATNARQIKLEEKADSFMSQLRPKPEHDVTKLTDEDIARIAAAIKAGK